MRPGVPSGSVLQQWWQEGLAPLPVLVQSFCNPSLPLPVLVRSGLLPQPTPDGSQDLEGCDFRRPERCLSGINSYHPFLMLLNPE